MKVASAQSRFHYTSEDSQPAIGRFCVAYNNGAKKAELVRECVAAGFILKEAGLQDFLFNLDNEARYQNATPLQKTHILREELIKFFGVGVGTTQTATSPTPIENQPVEEPQPSPSTIQSKVNLPKFGG